MLGLKTLHACTGDLCLDSILNAEEHKIRYLRPPIVTSKNSFRNVKLFNIPKYRANIFRGTLIIYDMMNL